MGIYLSKKHQCLRCGGMLYVDWPLIVLSKYAKTRCCNDGCEYSEFWDMGEIIFYGLRYVGLRGG